MKYPKNLQITMGIDISLSSLDIIVEYLDGSFMRYKRQRSDIEEDIDNAIDKFILEMRIEKLKKIKALNEI